MYEEACMQEQELEEIIEEDVTITDTFVDGQLVREEVSVREILLEGTPIQLKKDTVTAEEIAVLGGWSVSEGVLLIDDDNNERRLSVDEVIVVETGMTFAKKVKFKRG
jgi:hypothetical protein